MEKSGRKLPLDNTLECLNHNNVSQEPEPNTAEWHDKVSEPIKEFLCNLSKNSFYSSALAKCSNCTMKHCKKWSLLASHMSFAAYMASKNMRMIEEDGQ